MTVLAVGRLVDADTNKFLGTAFAVSRRFALTAFHCVGDRDGIWAGRVRCTWLAGTLADTSDSSVVDHDETNDVALLRLDRLLPRHLDPIPLTADARPGARFTALGVLGELRELPLVAMSGEIVWPDGRLPQGADAIQLTCTQSAAGLSLHGLSGAPVLTGTPQHAVGLVRWNPPRTDNPALAAGAIVHAAPADLIMQRWPQLADSADLADLVGRLAGSATGDLESVTAAVQAVLMSGSIGLNKNDLTALPVQRGDGVMLMTDRGRMIVRIIRDARDPEGVAAAEEDVTAAVTARQGQTGQSYVALITDGARWHLHQVLSGNRRLMDEKVANPQDPAGLDWLDRGNSVYRQEYLAVPS